MSQTRTLSLAAAYSFGAEHGLDAEVGSIQNMVVEWDRSYTSSLRRGYVVELFERQGIMEAFKAEHWAYGSTPGGETLRRRFLRIRQEYEDFLAGRAGEGEFGEGDTGVAALDDQDLHSEQEFAAESDLRDFLANNLAVLEPGLVLYQQGGRSGVEFAVDSGRIDVLAVDAQKRYVVIELKLSRGREKTLGQVLYYMAWVDEHLGNGPSRGIIIAREIPDQLVLAAKRVAGMTLYRYKLSVSVEEVR